METKIYKVLDGVTVDQHALERSSTRGHFVDIPELCNYFNYQLKDALPILNLLMAFRRKTLFAKKRDHICLALKWTGFKIPNEDFDEDDIKTDAVFFFRGDIDGMYLDSMLFYPLENGGCDNCFLDASDIKYHFNAQGKMTRWETGWTAK